MPGTTQGDDRGATAGEEQTGSAHWRPPEIRRAPASRTRRAVGYEQPVAEPQVMHFKHAPLRTSVMC
jgi:hypothetical protein